MDRIRTLLARLQEQLDAGVSPRLMLANARLLALELSALDQGSDALMVDAPAIPPASPQETVDDDTPIMAILEVDEAEVEAELEAIKRNAQTRDQLAAHKKPPILFDDAGDAFHAADFPTLRFQPPAPQPAAAPTPPPSQADLNEQLQQQAPPSLNDQLQSTQGSLSLGDTLQEGPVKDLRRAIDLNDRFRFINELFRGDEAMYERSIKTINSFSIWPEAEYWIRRELKVKLGWNDQDETVRLFDGLVKRRFNA